MFWGSGPLGRLPRGRPSSAARSGAAAIFSPLPPVLLPWGLAPSSLLGECAGRDDKTMVTTTDLKVHHRARAAALAVADARVELTMSLSRWNRHDDVVEMARIRAQQQQQQQQPQRRR